MADASAARTKAVFEFKSATLPLIAVILKTADLSVLAEALDAQLADSPDFFDQEPVVIDLSQLQDEEAMRRPSIDFAALRALLARHQTQPDRGARRQRCAERRGAGRRPVDDRDAGARRRPARGRPRRRSRERSSRRSCARCRCRPTARW